MLNLMLTFTNTLTGKKEPFIPAVDKLVKLYVCGITPYDYAHLGHGRCYVTFDLLFRLLESLGYNVTYCRNFTDIDDKLLARAEKELGDSNAYEVIATRFINAYHEDMAALNCLPPTYEPRVTTNIPEIIAFIKDLIKLNKAYVSNSDVYFSIDSYPEYGKLSKRNLEDLRAGARVAIRENKKNPLDFALWKSEPQGSFWESPWGWGRPGWHIECSALAYKYLGNPIDIHGGGMDLIFPHHENEIAQSEARFGPPFARYWIHNAFVQVEKEKMSKSLGNFFTLKEIFTNYHPQLIRFYFLNHHYRAPMDFSFEDISSLQKTYQRLSTLFSHEINSCKQLYTNKLRIEQLDKAPTIYQKMVDFISDDLNTPGMFGVLFEHFSAIQKDQDLRAQVYQLMCSLLGLTFEPLPEKEIAITPKIQKLLDEREAARKAKDWKRSDELRAQLEALGIEVKDKKIS